eukprot:scaffold177218_cov18-Tisochrysis_lutea.AAC.1
MHSWQQQPFSSCLHLAHAMNSSLQSASRRDGQVIALARMCDGGNACNLQAHAMNNSSQPAWVIGRAGKQQASIVSIIEPYQMTLE